jgi:hypothetical protein
MRDLLACIRQQVRHKQTDIDGQLNNADGAGESKHKDGKLND